MLLPSTRNDCVETWRTTKMSTAVMAVSAISRSVFKFLRYFETLETIGKIGCAGPLSFLNYRYRYAPAAFMATPSGSPDIDTITAETMT